MDDALRLQNYRFLAARRRRRSAGSHLDPDSNRRGIRYSNAAAVQLEAVGGAQWSAVPLLLLYGAKFDLGRYDRESSN